MKRYARWRHKYLPFGLFTILAILGSCGSADYTGTYVGHHPFGADTLILRADSTYYHSFHALTGENYLHKGQWSGWPLKEFNRLDIQNFDWHIPGFGLEPARDTVNNTWPAQVERNIWDEQYIWLDSDLGYFYLKIKWLPARRFWLFEALRPYLP